MRKRITVMLVVLFLLMTGCQSSIDSLSYSDGEYQYSQVQISIAAEHIAYKDIDKTKLHLYAKTVAAIFGYTEVEAENKPDTMLLAVVKKTPLTELDAPDEDTGEENKPIETGRNWFYATYEYETENPFSVISKQYQETPLTYVEGDPSTYNTRDTTIGAVLKNGLAHDIGGVKTLAVAPFLSEFPSLKDTSLDGIKCSFYWGNNKNMSTNGNKIKSQGNTFYVFATTFGDDDAVIKYELYYPVSLGWNLVAIGAAIVVVVLILLFAKKGRRSRVSAIVEPEKLNKPIVIDPFDSKPLEKTNSKINPFDGY